MYKKDRVHLRKSATVERSFLYLYIHFTHILCMAKNTTSVCDTTKLLHYLPNFQPYLFLYLHQFQVGTAIPTFAIQTCFYLKLCTSPCHACEQKNIIKVWGWLTIGFMSLLLLYHSENLPTVCVSTIISLKKLGLGIMVWFMQVNIWKELLPFVLWNLGVGNLQMNGL